MSVSIPITSNGSGALATLQALQRSVGQLKTAVNGINASLARATGGLGSTGAAAGRAAGQVNGTAGSMGRATRAANDLTRSLNGLKGAFSAAAAAAGLVAIARMADDYTSINNKLRLVTTSTENLTAVNNALFASANSTRSSYADTAQVYTQLARNAGTLGLSQVEVLGVTQTLNQAFQISGASASESASGLRQFGQAMASGVLRGDEFNSLMENAPRIMEAVAAGMDKPITSLRAMAEAGELSALKVVEALQSQSPKVAAEFARMNPTIASSFVVLKNNMTKFIGDMDRAVGASKILTTVVIAMANNLPAVAAAVATLGIAFMVAFGRQITGALNQATAAVGRFTLAIASNPVGLLLVAIAAGITALVAFRNQIKLFGDDTKKAGDQSISLGDVMAGTWDAAKEKLGQFTKWFGEAWEEAKNQHGASVMSMGGAIMQFAQAAQAIVRQLLNAIIGGFVGGFRAITEIWNNLPAIFSDIAVSAGNALIAGLETAINRVAQMVKNGPLGGLVGGLIGGGISIPRINNSNAGAAGRVGSRAMSGRGDYVGAGAAWLSDGFRGLGERGQGLPAGGGSVSDVGGDATAPVRRDKGGSDAMTDAEKALKDYQDALRDLQRQYEELNLTEREAEAIKAINTAGLRERIQIVGDDITTTDEQALAIIRASDAVFDATKRLEDAKQAQEDLTETAEALVDAQRELAEILGGAAAGYEGERDAINEDVDARRALALAMDVETAGRAQLLTDLERERVARLAVVDAQQAQQDAEALRYSRETLQDAQIDSRGVGDSTGAETERRILAIKRQTEADLEDLRRQLGADTEAFREASTNIMEAQKLQLETLARTAQLEKAASLFKDLKSSFSTLFTGTEDEKKAFFIDLFAQLLQAIIFAKLFKTTLGDAFTNFGGGGASGGLLGSIFGAVAKGGGGGAGGGMGGAIFGGIMSLFGKSGGGPMFGGEPYLVGEQGPELFVPPQNGALVPNNRMSSGGGGNTIVGGAITVTVSGGGNINASQLADEITTKQVRAMEAIAERVARKKGR